ncbi:ferrochelatase [Legionella moravica]|uniref:Ferrochelatase n=1 Tax=Legionella moravica TaxID=39962 RepID=A0A378K0W6_9GAMM|nr:ferrochelatase [Legionella moravica]KTD32647.1 ferrochelatase [Legionella moravica]STX61471.1 ferrochelatase [Legionella moravica]
MKQGLLLINLGTPNSTEVSAVKTYLSEFLTDKRVIDLPVLLRYVLVYLIILPFRAKKSAHAYQAIWTEQGSPLLIHNQQIANQLQLKLGADFKVVLGMRYGSPSILNALNQLKECESITILPLYPQYSSAATGSSIEEVMRLLAKQEVIPSITIIRDFFQHPSYINAQAKVISHHIDEDDFLLFSYHGIPERQVQKSGCKTVCQEACPTVSSSNQGCYKAQCHETSRLLASALNLTKNQYTTSFQSRLGKTPWIKPYTDELLSELVAKGIKNLAVVCPSFVTDCLETLEEMGIRTREQWLKLGGKKFTLIPCMNDDPDWISAIIELIKK